jgi:hypothetical protein
VNNDNQATAEIDAGQSAVQNLMGLVKNAVGDKTQVSEQELRKLFTEDENMKEFVEKVHGIWDSCPKLNGTRELFLSSMKHFFCHYKLSHIYSRSFHFSEFSCIQESSNVLNKKSICI